MLAKDSLLKGLRTLYTNTGDARFLYVIIGLDHGFLSTDEAEGRRREIQDSRDRLELESIFEQHLGPLPTL